MSRPVDTNVDNYTISELLLILDIDKPNIELVEKKTDFYIDKFTTEKNNIMVVFFQDVQNKLLDYVTQLDEDTAYTDNQTTKWIKNEVLEQSNKVQKNKNTDRKQKIDIYNNPQVPMNREQLGVTNTISLPVAQDVLNPNLKNTTSRIIVLDSQYRQASSPNETSTDYTLDLSEPLLNVLSLRLYSFAIPYTWYTIDESYGNTCLWLSFIDSSGNIQKNVRISIPSGNYSQTKLVTYLTNSFINAGFNFSNALPVPNSPVAIDPVNAKITFNLYGATYSSYTVNQNTVITFFDVTSDLSCNLACNPTIAINQTLGWVIGFRIPFVNVSKNGNKAIAIPELYGPKYFILVIDDLNQNHINSGLIGITELSKVVKLPSYYSPDLPYTCINANPSGSNLKFNSLTLANDADAGALLMDKLDATYSPTPQVLPSAPRILTQSQIYTINEIMKNNEKTYSYRLKSPVVSDTFAILPIKLGSMNTGDVNVEFGGSMQDNKRVYFGPVNISRLRVKLLDDRGNVVNLNGCDWCVTIISENLYQY